MVVAGVLWGEPRSFLQSNENKGGEGGREGEGARGGRKRMFEAMRHATVAIFILIPVHQQGGNGGVEETGILVNELEGGVGGSGGRPRGLKWSLLLLQLLLLLLVLWFCMFLHVLNLRSIMRCVVSGCRWRGCGWRCTRTGLKAKAGFTVRHEKPEHEGMWGTGGTGEGLWPRAGRDIKEWQI